MELIKKDADIVKLEADLAEAVIFAEKLTVNTKEDAVDCGDNLKMIKEFIKRLKEKKDAVLEPYKTVIDNFNNSIKISTERAEKAKDILNKKYLDYCEREEKRKREEARREAERLAAETLAKAKIAEDELLQLASSHLELEGLVEQAIQVTEFAERDAKTILDKTVVVERTIARSDFSTSSIRKTWKGEVTDMGVFIRFVLVSKRYELVTVSPANINAYARNVGKNIKEDKDEVIINGIRLYQEKTTTTR